MKTVRARLVAAAIVGFAASACALPARAVVVNYAFSGSMVDAFGSYPVGTPFNGSITYDDAQSDIQPATPNVGNYLYTSFSLTVGSDTVNDAGTGQIYVYDNLVTPYPTDLMIVAATGVSGTIGGLSLGPNGMQLALQDVTGSAFSGIGLPGPGLTLADFTQGNATFVQLISTSHDFARGELETLAVPEPSTAVLAFCGLILLTAGRTFGVVGRNRACSGARR